MKNETVTGTNAWIDAALSGDRDGMRASFPWAAEMAACPQDVLYHAEGDVWTHTMMVYDQTEMRAPALTGADQVLRLSALLHDSAKPETTVFEWCPQEGRDRVRQPNHSRKGAEKAWRSLTDAGVAVEVAREVTGLCFWHQRPTHIAEQNNQEGRICRYVAEGGRWDRLLALCESDQSGRVSPNVEDGLIALGLLRIDIEALAENMGADLMAGQAPDSPEWRVRMGESWGADPFYAPPDQRGGADLIVMSGLPGSGKSTLAQRLTEDSERPMTLISLDALRAEFARYKRNQEFEGRVYQEAVARLRGALARREAVIWDACGLDQRSRAKPLRIGRDYGARLTVISVDEPASVCSVRNSDREFPVPADAFARMCEQREMVLSTEAHSVLSARNGVLTDVSARAEVSAIAPAP